MNPAIARVALNNADRDCRGRPYALITDGTRYEYFRRVLTWSYERASELEEGSLLLSTQALAWVDNTVYSAFFR